MVVGMIEMAANHTLGNGQQPFFIGAGLHKPHLPFYAPQEMYALYEEPVPPLFPLVPADSPYVAWHGCLSNAPGANNTNWGDFTDIPNNMTYEPPASFAFGLPCNMLPCNMLATLQHVFRYEYPMQDSSAARLRRGYYASVTYTDANVGALLAASVHLAPCTLHLLSLSLVEYTTATARTSLIVDLSDGVLRRWSPHT